MKQKARFFGILTAILGGVLAFALRFSFLQGASSAELSLWIFTAIIVLVTWFQSRTVKIRSIYVDCFSSDKIWLIPSILGALGLVLGNGLLIFSGVNGADAVIAYLGLVAGGSIAVIAIGRHSGTVMSLWIHAAITIYLIVKLIFDFRDWSVDPTLMDYCFSLFAAICAMLANCQIGLFVLGKGHSQRTIFWCILATVFSLCAIADGNLASQLILGGMAAWTVANAGQLLENPLPAHGDAV